MSEITKAIETRRAQITQLQSDIDILRRAAGLVGGKGTAPTSQPKAKQKVKRKRRKLSAAARKIISEKVKASWAKRKRARR